MYRRSHDKSEGSGGISNDRHNYGRTDSTR